MFDFTIFLHVIVFVICVLHVLDILKLFPNNIVYHPRRLYHSWKAAGLD
jgi:hypothetical protein